MTPCVLNERGARRRELFESQSYISAIASSDIHSMTIDFYRWDNIATATLLLSQATPQSSPSLPLDYLTDRHALNSAHKFILRT
jgi:hypothetical protein